MLLVVRRGGTSSLGRTLILSRYTEPEPEQQILLDRLHLRLPEQPPPRISSNLQTQIA